MIIEDNEYQKKEMRLAAGMGVALGRWALLEGTLLHITIISSGQDSTLTARLMGLLKTFALTLDYADTCVRHRLGNSPAITHWHSLKEYAQELSGDRNYIAHGGIVRHTVEGDPPSSVPFVGPSTNEVVQGKGTTRAIDADELQEIILDFQDCYHAISAFAETISGATPWPEKYLLPFSRRRPPRAQRLEAKRQESERKKTASPPKS